MMGKGASPAVRRARRELAAIRQAKADKARAMIRAYERGDRRTRDKLLSEIRDLCARREYLAAQAGASREGGSHEQSG